MNNKKSIMKEYHKNPRKITEKQLEQLRENMKEFGDISGIVHDLNTDEIISGNQRSKVVDVNKCEIVLTQKLDEPDEQGTVAWGHVIWEGTRYNYRQVRWTDEQREKANITANALGGMWDYEILENGFNQDDLINWGLTNLEEQQIKKSKPKNATLSDAFVIPPFSILDSRQGYWQSRKKEWKAIIGENGESRQDTLIKSPEIKFKDLYQRSKQRRIELGITFQEYLDSYVSEEVKQKELNKAIASGVSLLDPVMAEIICRWFGYKNCKTFDPFAGDTVFGFVSAYLGNQFTGIEIREEQAQLNNDRCKEMNASYINDDGQNVAEHLEPESQDLMFSCPPYYDLEHYSDLENDASNAASYEDFMQIIENAFAGALKCLRNNRFAVIVVGDIRDKRTGFYYDFPGDIKRVMKKHGAELYNELILVESGASTALRAGRYMETRKVAKCHQNVMVFYKGDHNFKISRAMDSRQVANVAKNIMVFYKGDTKEIKNYFKKIEYGSEDLELFGLD